MEHFVADLLNQLRALSINLVSVQTLPSLRDQLFVNLVLQLFDNLKQSKGAEKIVIICQTVNRMKELSTKLQLVGIPNQLASCISRQSTPFSVRRSGLVELMTFDSAFSLVYNGTLADAIVLVQDCSELGDFLRFIGSAEIQDFSHFLSLTSTPEFCLSNLLLKRQEDIELTLHGAEVADMFEISRFSQKRKSFENSNILAALSEFIGSNYAVTLSPRGKFRVRFYCLDGSPIFKKAINKSKAVVLFGGQVGNIPNFFYPSLNDQKNLEICTEIGESTVTDKIKELLNEGGVKFLLSEKKFPCSVRRR